MLRGRLLMTDQECHELYAWLLLELDRIDAGVLAREIDDSVRRGVVREEEGEEKGKPVAIRVRLTGRERLAEALRLVVSAASVPLMLEAVGNLAGPPSRALRWAPDFIEEAPESLGDDRGEKVVNYDLPDPARLHELAAAAATVLSLVTEIEAEAV